MTVVKPKSVVILGVDLPLEPFIDSAYLQDMLDDLNTKEDDPKRFMHNARVIARYMEQDSLTLMLKNQETYFTGIAAEDKLFDYKSNSFDNISFILSIISFISIFFTFS